jgi:hypothetical protein
MKVRALARPLVLCLLAAGVPLAAQSYQSSFSDVKVDRAHTPATFIAGARVDAATGAVSLDIPLGPGIGRRGAVWVPTVTTRIAPQWLANRPRIGTTPNFTHVTQLFSGGSGNAELTPGRLKLWWDSEAGDKPSEYGISGGPTGSVTAWPAETSANVTLTVAQANQILQAFSLGNYQVANFGSSLNRVGDPVRGTPGR